MNDWRKQIPAWLWDWVSDVATDTPIYLVGGVVRDWLLGRTNTDLDLVIEGDAIAFAYAMQAEYGGSVVAHNRFGTAKWTTKHGEIDFVMARAETYATPAALPTVTPGSMADDLRRRDFTINALALRLDQSQRGRLVDQHNGQADLENGIVRVLHENSFVDDPTRIFRGVRYEQRLGFTFEPQTLAWLQRDKASVAQLSGDRVRHEIVHILEEDARAAMLARLDELGVLAEIAKGLHWQASWEEAFAKSAEVAPVWGTQTSWEIYLLLWVLRLQNWGTVLERLNVGKRVWKSAENTQSILQTLNTLLANASPSQITFALDPFHKDTTALLVAHLLTESPQQADWLTSYQTTWRTVRAPITGADLRRMGLQPGPHFRKILDNLRGILLDEGTVSAETLTDIVNSAS